MKTRTTKRDFTSQWSFAPFAWLPGFGLVARLGDRTPFAVAQAVKDAPRTYALDRMRDVISDEDPAHKRSRTALGFPRALQEGPARKCKR